MALPRNAFTRTQGHACVCGRLLLNGFTEQIMVLYGPCNGCNGFTEYAEGIACR